MFLFPILGEEEELEDEVNSLALGSSVSLTVAVAAQLSRDISVPLPTALPAVVLLDDPWLAVLE